VSNALASPLDSGYNSSVTHIVGLPLFPLHTVLFPGQLLPLHIFEPRYRLMVTECLAGQSTFGVVLIQEGAEVGDEATPFDVGTTARIEQVNRLDDGRFNILCVGQARFRVLSLRHNRPYLSGDVDLWPWEPPAQEQPDPRTAHVKSLLTTYLQRLAHATGNTVQLDDMPDEPAPLAHLAAIVLQIPNQDKQALLSLPTIDSLMTGCIEALKRENRALAIAPALPSLAQGDVPPFSLN